MSGYTKTVLLKAADLVSAGWFQLGRHRSQTGPGKCYCAMTAIMYAARVLDATELEHEASVALRAFLDVGSLATWNDAPERTQSEVVAALRAAAGAQP